MDATSEGTKREHRARLNEALRSYGEEYDQIAQAFAASAGVHSTDATALVEILRAEEQGEPLSPARLSDRIGLTSGATTALLNRLETAGHIRRSRVNTDRRVVTLLSTPGIHQTVNAFFDPLEEALSSVMDRYEPADLDRFTSLLEDLRAAMSKHAEAVGHWAS